MTEIIDITGRRFNKLVVISRNANRPNGDATWLCACDCGNKKIVVGRQIRHGGTKSCGCLLHKEPKSKTHGMFGTPTYSCWANMKARCTRVNHPAWKRYGGRGITFCEEWRKFEGFLADMGEKPNTLTLDRIDNNGNYCAKNCRWATHTQQRLNQGPRSKHIFSKSRTERRKNHNNIKLSEEKVKFIRDSIANNKKISIKKFSLKFNVAPKTIEDVINGVTWLP